MLIANSNLVRQVVELGALSRTGTQRADDVWPDDGRIVDIYRQPGHVQGTYETFAEAGAKALRGSLEGKLVVSGGMGGMGGAQPLAATMNGARFLGIDVDPKRIEKRAGKRLLRPDGVRLDEALAMLDEAKGKERRFRLGWWAMPLMCCRS